MTDAARVRAAFAAEWIKIRTVRSTLWTLLLSLVVSVGLGLLVGHSMSEGFSRMDRERQENFDPVAAGFLGLTVGQIALVVFGVLQIGAEYTSGTIRASLMAVPRRGLFYGAKVAATMLTALVFSLFTVYVTFFAAQWALGPQGMSLGDPGVLRATLGAWAYLTLMCAFSIGVATMLRSTALTLGILIPLLFLNSQGLGNVPKIRTVAQFLPDQAGAVMMQVVRVDESFVTHRDFGPGTALVILLAWTVAALVGGSVVLRRRDP
ncbi:ABC transporter permease [Streptomyces sp. ME19-01-6]|uniref:ABC transporter permease n=1 Tax=Streptomyces sp. ME19-01-6 TaxID=3028686 RepID=UPI0029BC1735|nr:ABC transporter permease [Streptomyces sp. ME19-01-6]MDX3228045.1 ABC transporter permease subunit [Streptomyces sp. ME19-01-6]